MFKELKENEMRKINGGGIYADNYPEIYYGMKFVHMLQGRIF